MFLLELPHQGDSHEYTQYTICNINKENKKKRKKKQITLNYSESADMRLFPGDSRTIRNSPVKRAISVRATEGLLYVLTKFRGGRVE